MRLSCQGKFRLSAGSLAAIGATIGTGQASDAKHHTHRHRQKKPKRCVPITAPFTGPTEHCAADKECRGHALCCTLSEVIGSGCFDLRNNDSACGTTCENAHNCINFANGFHRVNGACVAS
jgi:hypothetical protein